MVGIIILIVIFLIWGFWIAQVQTQASESKKKFYEEHGIEKSETNLLGKYMGGHPYINVAYLACSFFIKENLVKIIVVNALEVPEIIGEIPLKTVKKVSIENASTMERRVTVGRLLMVGMFAFALKKKKETEIAYIVIEWADEIGEHETIFELGSLMMANRSRSTILLALNEVKKKDKKAKNTN